MCFSWYLKLEKVCHGLIFFLSKWSRTTSGSLRSDHAPGEQNCLGDGVGDEEEERPVGLEGARRTVAIQVKQRDSSRFRSRLRYIDVGLVHHVWHSYSLLGHHSAQIGRFRREQVSHSDGSQKWLPMEKSGSAPVIMGVFHFTCSLSFNVLQIKTCFLRTGNSFHY